MRDLLLEPGARYRGILSPVYVERLVSRHLSGSANLGQQLWTIMCFELWLRQLPDWTRRDRHVLRDPVASPSGEARAPRRVNRASCCPVHYESPPSADKRRRARRARRRHPRAESYEVILVCNGCDDGSDQIAAELAVADGEHVRCVSLSSRGLGTAIAAARGAPATRR